MLKRTRSASTPRLRKRLAVQRRQAGYTLIEFLVIIAILAMLVAMTIPAIQATRETSRRVTCRQHLRQIGLALHAYHDAFECWPAGSLNSQSPVRNVPEGYHHGWLTRLLPYMDEPLADRQLNRSTSVYSEENRVVTRRPLPVLRCPADPGPRYSSGPSGGALTSYAACHHDRTGPVDTTNSGAFILNRSLARDDIPDGLSQTLFVGEIVRAADDLGWASGTQGSLRSAGQGINGARALGAAAEDAVRSPEPRGLMGSDDPFAMEMMGMAEEFAVASSSQESPNRPPPVPRTIAPIHSTGGFSSTHSSGASFLLGDSRVVFLSQSIDMRVFRRLANRADGRAVADNE